MTETSLKGSVCSQESRDKSSSAYMSYYFHMTTPQGSDWLMLVCSLPLWKMFDFVHMFLLKLLTTKVMHASGIIPDYFPVLSL